MGNIKLLGTYSKALRCLSVGLFNEWLFYCKMAILLVSHSFFAACFLLILQRFYKCCYL